MQGRILTKAEIAEVQKTMSSDMGPTDVYLFDVVPNLLATVKAMRELLEDALVDYAHQHRPGCLGMFRKGANDDAEAWPCSCGHNEWQEKAKKLLGKET